MFYLIIHRNLREQRGRVFESSLIPEEIKIGKDKVNRMGKKCLFIPKGRVVRRGKIKCPSQVKCEGDIKRLLDANFHYINEFDF
jgi:hypothetical protein